MERNETFVWNLGKKPPDQCRCHINNQQNRNSKISFIKSFQKSKHPTTKHFWTLFQFKLASVTNCMQFFFKFQSKIAQIAFEISILDTIFQPILLVNLPYWSKFPIYLPYWAKAIFVLKKISKSCNLRHWPIFLMVHLIYTTQSYRTDRS